jgi:hypothetical protein
LENKEKLKLSPILLHQIPRQRNPDKLNQLIPKQEIKELKKLKQVRINLLGKKVHLHLEQKRLHRQAKHLLQEKLPLLLEARHHLPLLGRHHLLLPERLLLHLRERLLLHLLPEKHLHLLLQVKHHPLLLLAKVLHHLLLVKPPLLPLLQGLNLPLNQ